MGKTPGESTDFHRRQFTLHFFEVILDDLVNVNRIITHEATSSGYIFSIAALSGIKQGMKCEAF